MVTTCESYAMQIQYVRENYESKLTVTEVAIDVFWKITVSESLQLSKNNREVAHFNKVLEKEPSKPLRKY